MSHLRFGFERMARCRQKVQLQLCLYAAALGDHKQSPLCEDNDIDSGT